MIMMEINLWAVLAAGLAAMVLGYIWYAPPVFGKMWMKLAKVEKAKGGMAITVLSGLISMWVMAYVLAYLLKFLQAQTIWEGVIAGVWVWVGFVATVSLGSVIYERKPIKLYLLNNAFNLLSLAMMGVILTVWV